MWLISSIPPLYKINQELNLWTLIKRRFKYVPRSNVAMSMESNLPLKQNLMLMKNSSIASYRLKFLKIQLIDMFSDDSVFCLFVDHLSCEFSLECILSTIEMLQYRSNFSAHRKTPEPEANAIQAKIAPFCEQLAGLSCVPKSTIVFGGGRRLTSKMTMESHKKRARRLYLKYIQSGAEYEVNISFALREEMEDRFDDLPYLLSEECDITEDELHFVFDLCLFELLQIMKQSLSRMISACNREDLALLARLLDEEEEEEEQVYHE